MTRAEELNKQAIEAAIRQGQEWAEKREALAEDEDGPTWNEWIEQQGFDFKQVEGYLLLARYPSRARQAKDLTSAIRKCRPKKNRTPFIVKVMQSGLVKSEEEQAFVQRWERALDVRDSLVYDTRKLERQMQDYFTSKMNGKKPDPKPVREMVEQWTSCYKVGPVE